MRSMMLAILCFAAPAFAQPTDDGTSGAPATSQPPPSTPEYVAPPVLPPHPTPPPPPLGQDLRDQGIRNRAAGAALIAVGTMGLVGGVVMAGLAVECRQTGAYYDWHNGYYRERTDCVSTNDGLLAGGVVTGLVGTGLLLSGIVTHVVGRAQMSKARRMGAFTLAPTVTPTVQGASVRFAF